MNFIIGNGLIYHSNGCCGYKGNRFPVLRNNLTVELVVFKLLYLRNYAVYFVEIYVVYVK